MFMECVVGSIALYEPLQVVSRPTRGRYVRGDLSYVPFTSPPLSPGVTVTHRRKRELRRLLKPAISSQSDSPLSPLLGRSSAS
jgi:hypothetical protein